MGNNARFGPRGAGQQMGNRPPNNYQDWGQSATLPRQFGGNNRMMGGDQRGGWDNGFGRGGGRGGGR